MSLRKVCTGERRNMGGGGDWGGELGWQWSDVRWERLQRSHNRITQQSYTTG